MSIGDILSSVGSGLATAGRVAGAVAGPVIQSLAEEESGQAPEIQAEKRQQAMKLQSAAISSKAQDLESQLEMGRKYGTLSPDQQQQYVDAITTLYSHPSQMPTLIQKIHGALHPGGATYQSATPALPSATPQGGTAEADTELFANRTPKLYMSPDGKTRDWFTKNDHPKDWTAVPPNMSGTVRQGTHILIPHDAIDLMNTVGAQFNKQDGTPWSPDELSQFPEGTALAQFVKGDQIYYSPIDQRTKTSTFNNVVSQIPEAGQITQENQNPLGVARVPTTTTHQVPGMNPGEKITLTGTSTPATPASIISPSSAVAPKTGAQPVTPPSQKPVAQAIQTRPPTAHSPKGTEIGDAPPPFAPGTLLAQGKTSIPISSAMSVVGANVFGKGGKPALWHYARMYDDPKLGTALNKALTMNSLTMPGVKSEPGVMESIATASGVTGWSQEQINQAAVDARKEVQRLGGDDAMKFLSRLMAFQEDLSALRRATAASGAQGSIATLVRAAPIYNVSSSKDFRNQLEATLSTGAAALDGDPMFSRKYVDWWKKGASAAGGEGEVNSQTATPQRPPHVPSDYVFNANGPKGRGWYAPAAK